MNNFFIVVLITVSAALGVVVGETYAPISGRTVYALTLRVEALETRVEELSVRLEKLDRSIKAGGWATPF